MTQEASFAGKWRLKTSAGMEIAADEKGVLGLAAGDSRPPALIIYGPVPAEFILQIRSGGYLSASADPAPVADQPREGAVARLGLETGAGGTAAIRRLDAAAPTYLTALDGGKLAWQKASGGSPPPEAFFARTIVTPSLAEIQAKIVAPEIDLAGVHLSGEKLDGLNLTRADLSEAQLSGAGLKRTNLDFVRAEKADFSNCDLSQASLIELKGSGAIFRQAILGYGCNLSRAQLEQADLRGARSLGQAANLGAVSAPKADFTGASLPGVIMNQARLPGARLVDVDLAGASLGEVNFQGALMTSVNLTGAVLARSVLAEAVLVGTDFSGADLLAVDFTRADLTNTRLSRALGYDRLNLTGARLIAADLTAMNLTRATISPETNFTQALMDKVDLTGQKLDGVVFLRTRLPGAKLIRASLVQAVLVEADLSGAEVTGNVSLIGADLSNADLSGADFSGAQFGPLAALGSLDPASAPALDSGRWPNGLSALAGLEGHGLAEALTVTVREPGRSWLIETGGQTAYIHLTNGRLEVTREVPGQRAATLCNAFMADTVLTGANLYAVDLSGAHWYGGQARADNANLEQVNLAKANLATLDLSQARLYGADLSYANLVNTNFSQAAFLATTGLKPASLAFANLQGANFTEARLGPATLTNANVALDLGGGLAGTPLFRALARFRADLDRSLLPPELKQAFQDNGYALRGSPTVTPVKPGQSWLISQAVAEDDLSFHGYLNYLLTAQASSWEEYLLVHGVSPLRVIRVTRGRVLEPTQTAFGPTKNIESALTPATTCPSGLRYELLGPGLAYEVLMTPGLPPQPPACVPGPDHWCP